MIAVDTNLLVYAHRKDSEWYKSAADLIQDLAEAKAPWAIPFPCLHEFFSIVTHPRIFAPPSSREQALNQLDAWLKSPSLVLLSEGPNYWSTLKKFITEGKVTGPLIHDARIAAIVSESGVAELWTADRDFSRFSMRTRNPLLS